MKTLTLELSPQTMHLLEKLAECGLYGPTPEQVAERFVGDKLIGLLETSCIDLRTELKKAVEKEKRRGRR